MTSTYTYTTCTHTNTLTPHAHTQHTQYIQHTNIHTQHTQRTQHTSIHTHILYQAFNKCDVTRHEFALEWMADFEAYHAALDRDTTYAATLSRSLSLVGASCSWVHGVMLGTWWLYVHHLRSNPVKITLAGGCPSFLLMCLKPCVYVFLPGECACYVRGLACVRVKFYTCCAYVKCLVLGVCVCSVWYLICVQVIM